MLTPKKVKHRKWQTGRKKHNFVKVENRGIEVSFGSHGLKATSYARVNSRQLESARKVLSRAASKLGRIWIRVFPDRPVTQKPPEVGMGKGKGDPQYFCAEVFPGRVLFEIDGVDAAIAKEALRKAGTKLPLKTRIVERA